MKSTTKTLLASVVAIGFASAVWLSYSPEQFPVHTLPPTGSGVVDADLTQAVICNPNWSTDSIRPSVSYTNALKKAQLFGGFYVLVPGESVRVFSSSTIASPIEQQYYLYSDYASTTPALYEEDHVISLELGGSPDSPSNLWPEPYVNDVGGQNLGAHEKDKVENYLHAQVCSGNMTLSQAQDEIKTNWVSVYATMKGLNYTGGESVSDN